MKRLIAAGCFLLGLLATGNALICTQCSSTNPSSCVGVTVNCDSKHKCVTLYEVTRMGSQESVNFARGCGEKKMCDKYDTVTIKGGKYRLSTTCCDTDYCTPYTPSLPPENYNTNGVSCPYCESTDSKNCKGNEKVNCTGNENKCFLENREATSGPFTASNSIRGCSTKGYCELGTRKTQSGNVKLTMEIKCTNSANANHYTTLMPLIFGAVFLMKNVL